MKAHYSLAFFSLFLCLAGCSNRADSVRVTNQKAEKPVASVPQMAARSEPVFYNGKTYQLDFAPLDAGHYRVTVKGMGASQKKDAVAVGTSSIRYFACPDGKTGKLSEGPNFEGGRWVMTAHCG